MTDLTKLLHLSHAANATDGGIATAVEDLISSQRVTGFQPNWLTSDQFSPLCRDSALLAAALNANSSVVHIHGLWRSPTRIAARLAAAELPLVIAPHGMLDSGALAISSRKKQFVWRLWERRALQSARCLHALCPAEAASIRALFPTSPIALIPNGVKLPDALDESLMSSLPPPLWKDVIASDSRVLLFLGRFHSKKGLDPLLQAWQAVVGDAKRAKWWLALVGYGDGGALQRRVLSAQARGELTRVFVGGPVFGREKFAVLRGSSAFVLPSFSEGLPMAALEAMAHHLPCLLSSACNLSDAFDVGAALNVEPSPKALALSLQHLFTLTSAELASFGSAGRALVSKHYSWPQVAKSTDLLYKWIIGGGKSPEFVQYV